MKRLVKDKPVRCYVGGTVVAGVAITAAYHLGHHLEMKALSMTAYELAWLWLTWLAASLGFAAGASLYAGRPRVREWFRRHLWPIVFCGAVNGWFVVADDRPLPATKGASRSASEEA